MRSLMICWRWPFCVALLQCHIWLMVFCYVLIVRVLSYFGGVLLCFPGFEVCSHKGYHDGQFCCWGAGIDMVWSRETLVRGCMVSCLGRVGSSCWAFWANGQVLSLGRRAYCTGSSDILVLHTPVISWVLLLSNIQAKFSCIRTEVFVIL